MKYSQFNKILLYEGSYALFNAYTQKVMFIEEVLKDLLEAAKEEGIDSLKEYHPSFYEYLVSEKYLVEESLDEVELIKKLSFEVDNNYSDFFLTINPTMNCNFKCWYCYETHVVDSKLGTTMINKINSFIGKTMGKESIKQFNLSFFGGEPLLYFKKDVKPIIEYYHDKCKELNFEPLVGFTSNGFLVNDDFINFFKERDLRCSLQITLDGYKEKHDKIRYVSASRGSYEDIVKNIKWLIRENFYVHLRINYTGDSIDEIHKISNEFDDVDKELVEKNLTFDFHRVWQDQNAEDNVDEIATENIRQVRKNGYSVQSGYSADNVRNSCYADKRNSAVINYNGDLYKCTARDFTKEAKEGFLSDGGDLIWENDNLEKRMSSKFKNKPCLSCHLLPICNGGCSQHAVDHLDNDTEYCVFSGPGEKDVVVRNKIEEILSEVEVAEV